MEGDTGELDEDVIEQEWEDEQEAEEAGGHEGGDYEQDGDHNRDSEATSTAGEYSTLCPSPSASFVHENEATHQSLELAEGQTQHSHNIDEGESEIMIATQVCKAVEHSKDIKQAGDTKETNPGTNIKQGKSGLSTTTSEHATVSKHGQGDNAPALKGKSWAPTTPWRKEIATAPVRPSMASKTPTAAGVKTRKTSDSIKSLVDMFEGLTAKSTPEKGS